MLRTSLAAVSAMAGLTFLAQAPEGMKHPEAFGLDEERAPLTRQQRMARLKSEQFDVLVIGGGCVGSGIALDAQSRNLKSALVEMEDFCAGTSSRSTKLIHGGVRYLEKAFKELDYKQLSLVNDALAERSYLMRTAPHLAHPLPIMIPLYQWWKIPYFWAGAKMYDLLAGRRSHLPSSHFMSRQESIFRFPMIKQEGLKGSIVYYDGQHNDARMGLHVALTADTFNSTLLNHAKVVSLHKDANGKLDGAIVRDTFTQEEFMIKAKCVINATGPFVDHILKLDDPAAEPSLIPAAGVHITLPDHFSPHAQGLIVPKTADGRVLFFLPWEGGTICGTTDHVCEVSLLPTPTKKDVDFIVNESSRYLGKKITPSDIKSVWSGIRPLALEEGTAVGQSAQISRDHVVRISESGLISVTGGKWTTFRLMAEHALDKAGNDPRLRQQLPKFQPCQTKSIMLVGSHGFRPDSCDDQFGDVVVRLRNEFKFDRDTAQHLTHNYGSRAIKVAELALKEKKTARIFPQYPFIEAEVIYGIRFEMACTLVDVLARRLSISFLDVEATREVGQRVLELMKQELQWSSSRCQHETEQLEHFLATMSIPPDQS